jgi:hypothetical protein
MMMVLLVCLLIGALLGQRFKVFILVPAMVPAVALAVIVAEVHGAALWQILVTAFMAATSLQIGYLAGVGVRHFTMVERASRLRPRRLAAPESPRPARQLADGNPGAASL